MFIFYASLYFSEPPEAIQKNSCPLIHYSLDLLTEKNISDVDSKCSFGLSVYIAASGCV